MTRTTLALSAAAALASVAALAGLSARTPTPAPAPAPALTAAADTWTIDNGHSSLLFKTTHFVTPFYGRFNKYSGSFSFDDANPSASSLSITVDVASVDTGIEGRDAHLRRADFFNAAVNPTATFTSTSVTKTGDKTWNVTGDLTINGVTKSVTCTFTHAGFADNPRGGKVTGIFGEVVINRQEFNVKYGSGMLGDEVTLIIALEGKQ